MTTTQKAALSAKSTTPKKVSIGGPIPQLPPERKCHDCPRWQASVRRRGYGLCAYGGFVTYGEWACQAVAMALAGVRL